MCTMERITKDIESITFGLLSSEEILKMSVAKIDNTKLLGPSSVYDDRLGTISDVECKTCRQGSKLCSGHFGHVELVESIINPLFYKEVRDFLSCICMKCNRFLLMKDQLYLYGFMRYKGQKRFEKILDKLKKIDQCCHCDSPHPEIKYIAADNNIAMVYHHKNEGKICIILSVDEIDKIFNNIPISDIELMGFDISLVHPRNFIMKYFPVIPICARPYIMIDGILCDDDLTIQIMEIIKANNHLIEKPDQPPMQLVKKQKYLQSLKFRISTFYNNCVEWNTPILLWNGTIKCANDIVIGDKLIGDDGTVRTVKAIFYGEDDMYEIFQFEGNTYYVNGNHFITLKFALQRTVSFDERTKEWCVYWFDETTFEVQCTRFTSLKDKIEFINSISTNNIFDIPVIAYLNLSDEFKQNFYGVKLSIPVKWKYQKVKLSPYMIGLYIGSGFDCTSSLVTEMWMELCATTHSVHSLERNGTFLYLIPDQESYLYRCLREYGLMTDKRRIPQQYMVNHIKIRMELLEGLIDSLGIIFKYHRMIVFNEGNNPLLLDDIKFLAESLGIKTIIEKTETVMIHTGFTINRNLVLRGELLTSLNLKIKRHELFLQTEQLSLQTEIFVKPSSRSKYVGISVDKNMRLLLGDFTITRNSQGKAKHTTNNRPIKGLKERMTGKEGQMRGNLLGKRCCCANTPILLYDKATTKLAKNICVGDVLIGDNGMPRVVKNVIKGVDKMYEVKQEFGDTYRVNSEHVLTLFYEHHGYVYKRDNSIWVKWYDSITGKICENVFDCEEQASVFLSSINTNPIIDISIQDYLQLSEKEKQRMKGVKLSTPVLWNKQSVITAPEIIGKRAVFGYIIPRNYIYNDILTRVRVMCGLMNTLKQKGIDKIPRFEENDYANSVILLMRSLGLMPRVEKTFVGIYQQDLDFLNDPFSHLRVNDYNIEISECEEGEFCGFEIDQNQRFLLGDFTITHNCEQTGRTVIGPDPTLKLGELAVPQDMAEILTVPIKVSELNYEKMVRVVLEGKANYLLRGGSSRITLKHALKHHRGTPLIKGDEIIRANGQNQKVINGTEILQIGDQVKRGDKLLENLVYPKPEKYMPNIGDIVEQKLHDGCVVILNRQPTLHKASMQAMRVVIKPYKTLRMNLSVTKGFNGDFDGDEMNIHNIASREAQVELLNLSTPIHNMISAQSSKPNLAIVQDSLLGAYRMTNGVQRVRKNVFFNILMKLSIPLHSLEARLAHIRVITKKFGKPGGCFTGRGLFSLLLPISLNYDKYNNASLSEPTVRIYRGVMYEGALDKTILGSAHNSLIQIIYKEYSPEMAADFIDNVQFLTNNWLLHTGFSVGLGDCVITDPNQVIETENVIQKSYMEAEAIKTTTNHAGIRELRVMAALNKAKDIGLKIAKDNLAKDNDFLSTVRSGSKGDFFNITQISGLLGQQNLVGQRVPPVLNHNKRTLPHYPFETVSLEMEYESRGFVSSSFIKGLNPRQFYFHAMSGREGVCDECCVANNELRSIFSFDKQCYSLVLCFMHEARHLNSGNLLKLRLPLTFKKFYVKPVVMTLGMVITSKIYGQSAGKEPKSVMVGYGSPSETARVPVRNERLAISISLKIQSSLSRN